MTSFVRSFVKCTVALCVLCAVAFAQPKPKAAVYIKGNPPGREVLRMAVNTFLIKTGMYQMIAVDAIDILAQEHIRQMSGSVSDNEIARLGRDAGAQYVCVVERSEMDGISYVTTSMVSVQSKIAELSDMKELPYGERVINIIEKQINAMLGITSEPAEQPSPSIATYLYVDNKIDVLVSFDHTGGTQTLTVSTDAGGGYEVSDLPAWCSVDKSEGSFSLTCAPNPTSYERREWFRVVSVGKTVVVNVYQSGSGALSSLSSYSSSADSRSDKPERERKSKIKRTSGYGLGGQYVSDFGGVITWSNSDGRLTMPCYGGGIYGFADWIYFEPILGIVIGGADWENSNAVSHDGEELPASVWRVYGVVGALVKFPLIDAGSSVTLFPIYGIEYDISGKDSNTTLTYYPSGDEVRFDGKEGRPVSSAMNALWGKFGVGIDIQTGADVYLSIEALYGIRLMANKYEKDYVAREKGRYSRNDAETAPGHGLTIRLGVGFKMQ